MNNHPTTSNDIRPPRFQFRLRVLLLVVAVAGTILGLAAMHIKRYHDQRQAAAKLEQFGGKTGWSWSGNATSIHLVGATIADEDLKPLANLPHLEAVYLGVTPITDDAVKHLKELKHLKVLSVSGTKMSPTGVADLRLELPQTEILDIGIGKPAGQATRERLVTGDE